MSKLKNSLRRAIKNGLTLTFPPNSDHTVRVETIPK